MDQRRFKLQIAICTCLDPLGSWLNTLRSMTEISGLVSSAASTYLIDEETQITWVTVQLAPSTPHPRPFRRSCAGTTPNGKVQTEV